MTAAALTSPQQSPVRNLGKQIDPPQPQSASKLPERINPLAEPVPSVQFWQGRDVTSTRNVNAILGSYYSNKTVKNDKEEVQYHLTTSSDKGGSFHWGHSDWTLKVHDPAMEKIIAEIKMPNEKNNESDNKCNGFSISKVRTVGSKDYITVKIGQFAAYDIYCFDQEKGTLTQNIHCVNNPTFMGKYLVSWRPKRGSYGEGVYFDVYNLPGVKKIESKFLTKCDNLWVDENTLSIHLGSNDYKIRTYNISDVIGLY